MRNQQKKVALTDDEWKTLAKVSRKSQDAIRILLKLLHNPALVKALVLIHDPEQLQRIAANMYIMADDIKTVSKALKTP